MAGRGRSSTAGAPETVTGEGKDEGHEGRVGGETGVEVLGVAGDRGTCGRVDVRANGAGGTNADGVTEGGGATDVSEAGRRKTDGHGRGS